MAGNFQEGILFELSSCPTLAKHSHNHNLGFWIRIQAFQNVSNRSAHYPVITWQHLLVAAQRKIKPAVSQITKCCSNIHISFHITYLICRMKHKTKVALQNIQCLRMALHRRFQFRNSLNTVWRKMSHDLRYFDIMLKRFILLDRSRMETSLNSAYPNSTPLLSATGALFWEKQ